MFEELDDILVKNMVLKPYLTNYCDKCRYSYYLEDEQMCRAIKLDLSDATCIRIVRCIEFKAINTSIEYLENN